MIFLERGDLFNLDKKSFDLSIMTIGLGWDVRDHWLEYEKQYHFDLDAYALLLNHHTKFTNSKDCIYYNNLTSMDGSIIHTGDNLTGKGSGDDEQLIIKLDLVNPKYYKILFGVNIYQAKQRKQHFGMLHNAFIRALDAQGQQMIRFPLSRNAQYEGKTSMLFAEVIRQKDTWKFKALGEALYTDKLIDVIERFI